MTISKRDAIKAQRTKKKRQRRMYMVLGAGAGIALLVLAFAWQSIRNSLIPVGSFVSITPVARPMENGKTIGNPNAKVKIEVYEDFQCPACKIFTEEVEKQLQESTYISSGQVYYEFMQYPIIDSGSITTKESHQAANASMCALDQGLFWDYHDILFTNQGAENGGSFSDKRLKAFAESLGLDMTAFNKCFNTNKHSADIEADFQKGLAAGVHSTPSVFLNGTLVTPEYIPTYDDLKSAIDAALASGG